MNKLDGEDLIDREYSSFLDLGNEKMEQESCANSNMYWWARRVKTPAVLLFILAAIGSVVNSGSLYFHSSTAAIPSSAVAPPLQNDMQHDTISTHRRLTEITENETSENKHPKYHLEDATMIKSTPVTSIHDIVPEEHLKAFSQGFGVRHLQNNATNATLPSFAPSVSSMPSLSSMPSSNPSLSPTHLPSAAPSFRPTWSPRECSERPSMVPSASEKPSLVPSMAPSFVPSNDPTGLPSAEPSLSIMPSSQPSISAAPSVSAAPSMEIQPSSSPSKSPSRLPSVSPSHQPSNQPSNQPSSMPSCTPPVIHATGYMVAWHSRGRGMTVWPQWQPANYGCEDPAPILTASCGEGANIEILDFPSNHNCKKTDSRTVVCEPQEIGHIPLRCDTDAFDESALILNATLSGADLSCNGCIDRCDSYGGDAVQRLFIFTNCHYDGLYAMEDYCSETLREDNNGNRYCEFGMGCSVPADQGSFCTTTLNNVTASSDGHFDINNGFGCVYTL